MTCQFCGSLLNDDEVECPFCGHKVKPETASPADILTERFAQEQEEEIPEEQFDEEYVEAEEPMEVPKIEKTNNRKKAKQTKFVGDAFKDIKKSLSNAAVSAKKTDSGEKQAKQSGGKKVKVSGSVITSIGLIACFILCIISLISVASTKSKLDTMNQEMLSLFYQLQNTDEQLANKINEMNKTVTTVNNTVSETVTTSANIGITKEPSDTATYLGRGSASDTTQNVPVFTVYATGTNLSFSWQRYDEASGTWLDIPFDASSNNEVYGLHIYTDVKKGYTELSAHGITAAAYGQYRCQIADSVGIKNTKTVALTERTKDA